MKKPCLILAPMYNVTDVVFRQMVAKCASPDIFITEFVNVDGLQSRGRSKLLPYLYLEEGQTPVLAQIWGKTPENYFRTTRELVAAGFAGIDINMGCPDKTVVKNNQCSALIKPENRSLAADIIAAAKEGAGQLPVSVKTRLGFTATDFSWHEFLLGQGIDTLTVHGRTTKEMSRVPARWSEIGEIKSLAIRIAPETQIIGNGDIKSKRQALDLCLQYGWDGAMLGRAIFEDPYLFADQSPWSNLKPQDKIDLYRQHLELFEKTYPKQERTYDPLKKFMKVYLRGFATASQLRQKMAESRNCSQGLQILREGLSQLNKRSLKH